MLGGELNGVSVEFKFVNIGEIKHTKKMSDSVADLETRLSEMNTANPIAGSCVFKMHGHYRLVFNLIKLILFKFRQQLCYEDDPKLAKMLNMQPRDIKQFDVFVKEKLGKMNEWSKSHISHLELMVETLQGQVDMLKKTNDNMKECQICLNQFDNDIRVRAKGKCQHAIYCMSCLRKLEKCPACRHPLKGEDVVPVKLNFV